MKLPTNKTDILVIPVDSKKRKRDDVKYSFERNKYYLKNKISKFSSFFQRKCSKIANKI